MSYKVHASPRGPFFVETVQQTCISHSFGAIFAQPFAHDLRMEIGAKILAYCERVYGTKVYTGPGEVNIIYLEGCNEDYTPNADLPDQWNDRSLIIKVFQQNPVVVCNAPATSEPGLSATFSKQAQLLGGVARIAIGFHEEKWTYGFHKGNPNHPALIQCAPITCHRDKNRDGKRTGDPITTDVEGLNQHGTRPNLTPVKVGGFSMACMVRQMWQDHLKFMSIVINDPRRFADPKFKFSTTVVDFSKMYKNL